ncbi:hypothetical protein PMAYCL1PPCAC_30889, partial [Pristionchus mayeri]
LSSFILFVFLFPLQNFRNSQMWWFLPWNTSTVNDEEDGESTSSNSSPPPYDSNTNSSPSSLNTDDSSIFSKALATARDLTSKTFGAMQEASKGKRGGKDKMTRIRRVPHGMVTKVQEFLQLEYFYCIYNLSFKTIIAE